MIETASTGNISDLRKYRRAQSIVGLIVCLIMVVTFGRNHSLAMILFGALSLLNLVSIIHPGVLISDERLAAYYRKMSPRLKNDEANEQSDA